jgi:hypothetical protein
VFYGVDLTEIFRQSANYVETASCAANSIWRSHSRPPERSVSTCLCIFSKERTRYSNEVDLCALLTQFEEADKTERSARVISIFCTTRCGTLRR